MIEEMDPPTLELISQKIRTLRQDNLIGRVLSKSQTGLTLLADTQEARINATNDLFVDYELKVETSIPKDRYADIESRRELRRVLTQMVNTNFILSIKILLKNTLIWQKGSIMM